MPIEQLVILALIQGLTEFLPISSSGHLVLAPFLFGWTDQGLAYDVAAHAGTLLAVVVYFRRDLSALLVPIMRARALADLADPQLRLLLWLSVATVPVCIVGLLAKDFIEAYLRSPEVIAVSTIVFGVVLGLADRLGGRSRPLEGLGVRGAIVIGVAQVLALIPGTSRSGITMTAGLAIGLSRTDAARFSFLMSIPVIFLAAALEAVALAQGTDAVDGVGLAMVFGLSALAAVACIWLFLNVIERIGMMPFVGYRLILGVALLIWF